MLGRPNALAEEDSSPVQKRSERKKMQNRSPAVDIAVGICNSLAAPPGCGGILGMVNFLPKGNAIGAPPGATGGIPFPPAGATGAPGLEAKLTRFFIMPASPPKNCDEYSRKICKRTQGKRITVHNMSSETTYNANVSVKLTLFVCVTSCFGPPKRMLTAVG